MFNVYYLCKKGVICLLSELRCAGGWVSHLFQMISSCLRYRTYPNLTCVSIHTSTFVTLCKIVILLRQREESEKSQICVTLFVMSLRHNIFILFSDNDVAKAILHKNNVLSLWSDLSFKFEEKKSLISNNGHHVSVLHSEWVWWPHHDHHRDHYNL